MKLKRLKSNRLRALGLYQLPFFYDEGTKPLGVGEFFCERIMVQKVMAVQFDYMVGVALPLDYDFIGCYPHFVNVKYLWLKSKV